MKIKSLSLKNFMSFKSLTLDLDKPGLNLVIGKNGSGKSTIAAAISYCLFGETIKGITTDSIVRTGEKTCFVSVELDPEDGSDLIVVQRSRTGKKSDLNVTLQDGTPLFPSANIVELQKPLNNWLGLDFNVFVNSVYFGRNVNKFFMISSDNERKELLESVLQMASFDGPLEAAKEKRTELAQYVEQAEQTISSTVPLMSFQETTLDAHVEELNNLKIDTEPKVLEFRSKIEAYAEAIPLLEADVEKSKAELEALDLCLRNDVAKKSAVTRHLITEYEEKKAAVLQKLIINFNDNVAVQISPLLDRGNELRSDLIEAKQLLDSVNKSYREQNIKLGVVTNEKKALELKIKNFGILSGTCAVCYSEVTPEHKSHVIEDLSKQHSVLQNQIEELSSSSSDLFSMVTECEEAVENIRDTQKDLLEQVRVKNQIIQKEHDEKQKQLDNEFNSVVKGLREDLAAYELERTKQDTERKINFQSKINSLKTEIRDLVKGKEEAERFIKESKLAFTKLETKISELRNQIYKSGRAIAEAKDNINKYSNELTFTNFWVEGFSSKGIKSFVFEQSLPYLTEKANYYLSFLTGGNIVVDIQPTMTTKTTGNVKEKIFIDVRHTFGAQTYFGCSEGEKRRIDLAVLLALQSLIANQAKRQWNFLVFDELFDTLDAEGLVATVDLLRHTLRDKTVFIISHNPDVKKNFDVALEVVNEKGSSRIQEV